MNKDFRGFAKEVLKRNVVEWLTFSKIFTDANQYVIRTDETQKKLSLEEKALMLATAVTVDYDYFSRHSGG